MIIGVILLVSLLLRLININQSLWLDEAVQAITAKSSFAYIFEEIKGDFHPPLYHFLMHFWVGIFGSSEIVLRMPSVLFGVGAVYFVYKLGKLGPTSLELRGVKRLEEIAAIFMATAPFHIFYSQEARMYSAVTFFIAGSMYFFLKILKSEKSPGRERAAYFLFTLLALYTDYFAFLILPVQAVFLILKKKYKFLLICSLAFLLIYLPWLPMLLTQLKTGALATQSLPAWGELVNLSFTKVLPLTFIKFSIGRIEFFNDYLYLVSALVIFIVLGSIIIVGLKKIKKQEFSWITILGWVVVPIFIAWISSLIVPNYQPFRLLLCLPGFYLLIAKGIFSMNSSKLRISAIIFVLILNLSSVLVYYLNPFFQREDWRGLTMFLKSRKGFQAILPSSDSDWPMRYYDPKREISLIMPGSQTREVKEVNGIDGNKIYYIRYLVPLFDPNEIILNELTQKGYTKTKETNFNQIPLWEFVKK